MTILDVARRITLRRMILFSLRSKRNKLERSLSFRCRFFYCSLMWQKGVHVLETSISVLLYLFALGIESEMILIDGVGPPMSKILVSELIPLPHRHNELFQIFSLIFQSFLLQVVNRFCLLLLL